jgi:hypothetical protein
LYCSLNVLPTSFSVASVVPSFDRVDRDFVVGRVSVLVAKTGAPDFDILVTSVLAFDSNLAIFRRGDAASANSTKGNEACWTVRRTLADVKAFVASLQQRYLRPIRAIPALEGKFITSSHSK